MGVVSVGQRNYKQITHLYGYTFCKLNKWNSNKWTSTILYCLNPTFQTTKYTTHWGFAMMNTCNEKYWNMDMLTSRRQLFGVDYFCGILLSCAQLNTPAHDWKGSPVKHRRKTFFTLWCILSVRNSKRYHCMMEKVSSAHLQLPAELQREW